MNYIVHGAGAIGAVVAARLSQAGRAVSLVARGEHQVALAAHGLTIHGLTEGVFALPVGSDARDLEIDGDTVVVLAMKTQDTFAAVEAHAELYSDLPILCFQNGVSNEEWLNQNGYKPYGVMVRIGARIDEPGVVTHTGARHAAIGCWPSGVDALCERVVADLIQGGLDAQLDQNVSASKWGKLVINLANAYLALTDMSVQSSFLDDDVRRFMADVEQEALEVLAAAEIEISIDGSSDLAARIERLRQPARAAATKRTSTASARAERSAWTHKSERLDESFPSTWQDLKAGRKTVEVDHFNGRIVELGRKHGIPTPLNAVLWERCTEAAARQLGPGTETEDSIRAAAAELMR